jgi:hypothetical protein
MPVRNGRDSQGGYYQWGKIGKKYYYKIGNISARRAAYNRAALQGRAIETSKHNAKWKK